MPKFTGTIKIGDVEHAFEVFAEHERSVAKAIGDWVTAAGGVASGFTIASVWHHWNDKNGKEMKTKIA